MSHVGHYIRKCSNCQSVVSQCRCPNFNGDKEVRWQSSCDKCHGVKPQMVASDNEPQSEPDPGAKMPLYDSRPDTYAHIAQVRRYVHKIIHELFHREEVHDASKLEDPERAAFDELTPLLKLVVYGTDDYRATLRRMRPALDHHYAHNSHHPEHEVAATEEWRAIGTAPGYEVSNLGRVRSLARVVPREGSQGDMTRQGQDLASHLTPKGYVRLQLRVDGKPSNRLVHCLVAEEFLGPKPTDEHEVNHRDGIKHNNRASNLEWATPSENLQHAYDTELRQGNAKYLVTCIEHGITTVGCSKMARALRDMGVEASDAGVWLAAVGDHQAHCGLTFTAEPIEKAREYSGIQGMSLVDLVEMLCDWKAAGERHENNPGLEHSIEINQARFGYSDELKKILLNTARLLA